MGRNEEEAEEAEEAEAAAHFQGPKSPIDRHTALHLVHKVLYTFSNSNGQMTE